MSNKFQRFIYNLSTVSVTGIIFSIVWYMQGINVYACAILSFVCFLLVLYVIIFIEVGKQKFSIINQPFQDITSENKWILAFVATYLLPLSELVIKDLNHLVVGIIALIIICILAFANFTVLNPVLYIIGYRFYTAKTANGIQAFTIISRRSDYRNKQQLTKTKRIFEDLLIDGGETK